jgi:hypothetical protein
VADVGCPENIIAKNTQTGSSLMIIWDSVEDGDFAGYNLYRSESVHDTAMKINVSPLTETQLIDEGLTENQVYYYWVCSEDLAGEESEITGPAICSPSIYQSAFILESLDYDKQYVLDSTICNIENNLIEDAHVYSREIVIDGIINHKPDISALQAEVDRLIAVVGSKEFKLKVEPGRFYLMPRGEIDINIDPMFVSCGFSIVMRSRDPYSYNYKIYELTDTIDADSKVFSISNYGNMPADLKISIQVQGAGLIINPSFQINDNSPAVFESVLGESDILIIDGPANEILVNQENRLMDFKGVFPSIPPDSTSELVYSHDSETTANSVMISIEFCDRWL